MVNNANTNPIKPLLDLIDVFVEIFLANVISPFLIFHEKFYSAMNKTLRQFLDSHNVPTWFTANFITYARTALVFPTLVLLAWGHSILPALLVILVDFGDFLDGVVARYWRDDAQSKKPKEEKSQAEDPDSFEVVTTGSPKAVLSLVQLQRQRSYGGFVDAVMDKAFVVPCWISLLHIVPATTYLRLLQYATFLGLILAETASGTIRFQAYFTAGGLPAPKVEGLNVSTSAVTADHVGKAKQTFQMVGTALYILPVTRYLGWTLLALALPLAYESVRRKIQVRVIYVSYNYNDNDNNKKHDTTEMAKTLRFWMQARAMGSKLVVGVPTTMAAAAARASASVDQVVVQAPAKADLHFLDQFGIDYCLMQGNNKSVTEEVMNCQRCLRMGEDGVVRLLTAERPKEE